MVGTCANPAYSARFHTLQRGKLFEVETTPDTELVAPAGRPPKFPPISRRIYSSLPCGRSVGNLRIIYVRRNGISVEPLPVVAGVAGRAVVNEAGNNLKRKHDRTSAERFLAARRSILLCRVPTVGTPNALAQFHARSSMGWLLVCGSTRREPGQLLLSLLLLCGDLCSRQFARHALGICRVNHCRSLSNF
jgi:hypothetical protein